ncbi:MAG: choice-of-anchor Q domain-containing protein [Deltaproteobacteria bacterium]
MRIAATLFALAFTAVTSTAHAATIVVGATDDGGQNCTLRDALRTAQNAPSYAGIGGCSAGSAGVDTIMLGAGTYQLGIGGMFEDNAEAGDLDIREDVEIVGAGPSATTIDAQGVDRAFHLPVAGVQGTLRQLSIVNGNPGQDDGGGVLVAQGAILSMSDARVASCQSFLGGGGIDSLGMMTLERVILEGNTTENDGGFRCLTTCVGSVTDVIVRNNTATGLVGGGAGAAGSLTAIRTQIIDNVHTGPLGAGGFSALQVSGGNNTITFIDSVIARNTTAGEGGGFRVGTIGGLFDGNPNVTLINTTIANNQGGQGGGLSIVAGQATLSNVTITDNTAATSGGGVWRQNGALRMQNSIVARNNGPGPDCSGQIDSLGYVLVANGAGCTVSGGNGNLVGDAPPIDAMLGTLGDFGGGTLTVPLLPGSPALDSGDPAGCTANGQPLNTDQRGSPRPSGAACDRGAYELQDGPARDGGVRDGNANIDAGPPRDGGPVDPNRDGGPARDSGASPANDGGINDASVRDGGPPPDAGESIDETPEPREAEDEGCSCTATTGATSSAWLACALLAWALLRRRR